MLPADGDGGLMTNIDKLMNYTTLVDILEGNRHLDRAVTFINGENQERRLPYQDVHARALGILYHLQAMGAGRGDKMIIFLIGDETTLGKATGANRERAKPTHPAVIGIPASQERVHLLYVLALDALTPFGERAAPQRSLAEWLLLRRS
jgi:hypothetical protein